MGIDRGGECHEAWASSTKPTNSIAMRPVTHQKSFALGIPLAK